MLQYIITITTLNILWSGIQLTEPLGTSDNSPSLRFYRYSMIQERRYLVSLLYTSVVHSTAVTINRYLRRSIHTISSDGRKITKRFKRKERRLPLDYDKYLVGRSYDLFKNAIRSGKSLQLYKQFLYHFCEFIEMTTEVIVSRYNSNENAKESIKLEHMVEDYAMLLQSRVRERKISAQTCKVAISPIKLLCEMNDIILNFKKIRKLLPRGNNSAVDEAYSRDQIKRMLEFADLRTKIPILFMASSGMEVQLLQNGYKNGYYR